MSGLRPAALAALVFVPIGHSAGGAAGQLPGSAEHAEARRLLDASDGAADAAAAVESAFAALQQSERFASERWREEAPEAGILLDEFTGAARASYRRERARYRQTLGDALAAAGDPVGAEREYRRAVVLLPRAETWRRLADLPQLDLGERVALLLRSWAAAPDPDRVEVLDLLRGSGAFRTENGLAAALDRFRFRAPAASRNRVPEGAIPQEAPFPALTLAVSGGAWSSARSFAEGRSLLLYFPAPGCPRCGEVIGDLQIGLRGRAVDLIAAVPDADLALMARIAQLTGAGLFQPEPQTASARSALRPRPIGHVARRAAIPFPPGSDSAEETLWLAARAGMSVWRLPIVADDSVRRRLLSLFRFLDDSPVAGGPQPLVDIPRGAAELIEILLRLEAGTEPLGDIEDRLLDAVRTTLRDTAESPPRAVSRAISLLRAAAALQAGDAARLALLDQLVPRFGERLLEEAQRLDRRVVRAVPGGRLRVAAGLAPNAGNRFAIQRDYEAEGGTPLVLSAVAAVAAGRGPEDPGELRALSVVPGRAAAVAAREGGFAFVREQPGEGRSGGIDEEIERETCVSWGPPEGPLREDCSAEVHGGTVVVSKNQLVRTGGAGGGSEGPQYRLRIDGGPEPPEVTALTEGLAAFAAGELDRAEAAFLRAAAAIGPGSVLDDAAVRFDLALVAKAQGDRDAALATLLAIGDASFPQVLETEIRNLYRTPGAGASPYTQRVPPVLGSRWETRSLVPPERDHERSPHLVGRKSLEDCDPQGALALGEPLRPCGRRAPALRATRPASEESACDPVGIEWSSRTAS